MNLVYWRKVHLNFADDLVMEAGMGITDVSTDLLAFVFTECTSISLFSEGCIQGSSQM